MKIKMYFAFFIFSVFLFYACQSEKKEASNDSINKTENVEALADTIGFKNENFGLNTKTNLDKTNRTFIRSAEVKFKTKSVKNTTEKVEDLTAKYNGYIINSNLQTSENYISEIPLTKDSSMVTKSFTVENNITIKVPNQQLDSILRELNSLVIFLDYRVIKAEDVSLQMLSSNWQTKRLDNYEKRMTNAIDSRGKKLLETNISEENLLDRQNQHDQIKINKMSLEDQVAFSTISLHIYQQQSKFKEMIANLNDYKVVRPYRVNIFSRFGDALIDGWYYFEELLLFFARIWFLILAGVAIYIFYRTKKKKKSSL